MRPAPHPSALRIADLGSAARTSFELRPSGDALAGIAGDLGFDGLRKLSFVGAVMPQGDRDWRLEARLGATVVQSCVVTLEPVTTRIDVPVSRTYLADYEEPDEPEAEMPQDDSMEPLGDWIVPHAVMLEALALAAPDYPRKEGVELGRMVAAEPGVTPMTDDDARPFAGLADLKSQLENDSD